MGPLREMKPAETNWYSNPNRPNGPDWTGGYVPERYKYGYGATQHATGAQDADMQRAIEHYQRLIDEIRRVPEWLRP